MLGEALRESSVLLLVFAPLEMAIQKIPFTLLNSALILAGVGFLLTLGILIEVVRE